MVILVVILVCEERGWILADVLEDIAAATRAEALTAIRTITDTRIVMVMVDRQTVTAHQPTDGVEGRTEAVEVLGLVTRCPTWALV